MRSRPNLLTLMCLGVEVFVLLLLLMLLSSIRQGSSEILATFAVALILSCMFAVLVFGYARIFGDLVWRQKSDATLFIVLLFSGALVAPVLLMAFDIHTRVVVSKLYRGDSPLRYYAFSAWGLPAALARTERVPYADFLRFFRYWGWVLVCTILFFAIGSGAKLEDKVSPLAYFLLAVVCCFGLPAFPAILARRWGAANSLRPVANRRVCIKCAAPVATDAHFCQSCGEKLV